MGGEIYKCVERKMGSDGKVDKYVIEDSRGNKSEYRRAELLFKVHNREITVVDIGITVDGLAIDTQVCKDWRSKYGNLILVTNEDLKNRHKYLLLGTLPKYDTNSERVVVGVNSGTTIFDNTSTVFKQFNTIFC